MSRRRTFERIFHPLIWRAMLRERRTTNPRGQPFDCSRTRELCIARGADPAWLDGELLITYMRNGPVLERRDAWGFTIIARYDDP